MESSVAIERLKSDIKNKVGRSMDTPADFDYLSGEILNTLKENISSTTLKRFFNYVPSDVTTRKATLSLLARFVGYMGWNDYLDKLSKKTAPVEEVKIESNKNNLAAFTNITLLYYNANDNYSLYFKAKRFNKWHLLKCLRPEYKDNIEYQNLLYKEFESSYMLSNDKILQVYGFEDIPTMGLTIIFEYAQGVTLDSFIEITKVNKRQVYKQISQIRKVINYLHSKGIAHNNITYSNIIVVNNGDNIKLTGFTKSTIKENNDEWDKVDEQMYKDLVKDIALRCKTSGIKSLIYKYGYNSETSITNMLSFTSSIIILIVGFILLSSKYHKIEQNSSVNTLYIYDSLSKIVIYKAKENAIDAYNTIDTISSAQKKVSAYADQHKNLKRGIDDYVESLLEENLPKKSPVYNLYKPNLGLIMENLYNEYFTHKIDSLRYEIRGK